MSLSLKLKRRSSAVRSVPCGKNVCRDSEMCRPLRFNLNEETEKIKSKRRRQMKEIEQDEVKGDSA